MGGGKSNANQPKRLMGLDLTGAQYGACIPVVFGQNKVPGNIIWYGDFKAVPHKEKQAGKGGGGKSNTTYTYTSSFQIGLCEGTASVVNVYDGTTTKTLAAGGGLGFTGTLTQAAWAHLSGVQALTYSGTAHADFQDYNLGSSASLPNLSFEMAARNQFGSGILDANPADIITAICSDTQVGIGFTALGDLTALRNYASAASIFFSPVYDQQQPAMQSMGDLLKFANTATWFSEGVLKFQPYGDTTITANGATYAPVMTSVADLGPNDFITNGPGSAITIKRKAPADAQNMVRLDYKDRSANYRTITVQASIDQDLVANGARALSTESCDMITTGATARLVTQNLLQRTFYVRNQYEFRLSWRWLHLEPMDIVTLTDSNTGLALAPVRIIEVAEDSHGLLTVIAEELPDGIGHAATYSIQAATAAGQDTNADPGAVTAPFVFRAPGFLVSAGAPEIWVAVDAVSALWGGCDVYISNDGGTSYNFLRTHNGGASYGKLTNTMAVQADLDTVSAPNVVLNGPAKLLGGAAADRDQFITMSVVDSEVISYQTATLAAGPSYTLGSLRRGGYGTAIAAHAVNAPFARLDENILRIPVDPSQIGNTIYLKFLSFNVFGQFGPRTLASETAYAYVIGTCVEFPDVPVSPASFTATGVADGVNLSWTNTNPAAVDCTSIEYSSVGATGPWTVLGQAGPTDTRFHHAFTSGATYWYRARSRGAQVAAGWSAYTAVVTGTGYNATAQDAASLAAANAAQTDATTALNSIVNFSDDNLLTPNEKPPVIRDRDQIVAEQTGIDAQATAFAITTEKTAYDSAVTSMTSYLATLTSPVLWSNLAGNTTIAGGTFRTYFLNVYSARQTLLNKIATVAKAIADGKTTNTTSTTAPLSPNVDDLWYNPNLMEERRWTGAAWVVSPTAAQVSGGANFIANPNFTANQIGTVSGAILSLNAPCSDGWVVDRAENTYAGQCAAVWLAGAFRSVVGKPAAVANGTTIAPEIHNLFPIAVKPGSTYMLDYVCTQTYDSVLTGGVTATSGCSVQFYNAAGTLISQFDLLRARAAAQPSPLSILAPTNAATAVVYLYTKVINSSGAAWTHAGSYALQTEFTSVSFIRKADVEVVGSGVRIGDNRNLNQLNVGNGTAKVPTVVTYTSTTTTATISVAAWTMLNGSNNVSYGAKSVGVSGTGTVNYFLYLDDPTFSGTGTLVATTNGNNVYGSEGRVYVGSCAVTYAAGGSGGGGGGGGGTCVCVDMFLFDDCMAMEAQPGVIIDCLDLPTSDQTFKRGIGAVRFVDAECVRIETDAGAILDLSATTPFDLLDGGIALAAEMIGQWVVTDWGVEQVIEVTPIGMQPVARISVGGVSYAAGVDAGHRIYSHNALKP
jgi:hypothetical protein